MVTSSLEALDETLLLLSEARERAERAVRETREGEGPEFIAEALERVDQELLTLHRRLMDETYFRVPGDRRDGETQLALDAA
jgi:hypothetical protein